MYVFVFVHDRIDVVDQRLPKHGHVLVLVVELLLVVVRRGESLPGEGVDEQRVLLQVLLQRVLLRYDPRIVVVVDVVAVVLQVVVRVRVGQVAVRLVLAVLHVVELLVGEVVEGEVAGGAGRVDRAPFAGRKAQDGAHFGGSKRSQ